MKFLGYVFVLFSLFSTVFFPLESFAGSKNSKKIKTPKKGVILKPEGFYIPLTKKDIYKIKKTSAAISQAKVDGYMSAEEYYSNGGNCGGQPGPHLLQPSEVINLDFSFRHNSEEVLSSQLTLSPGFYQITLYCAGNPLTFVYIIDNFADGPSLSVFDGATKSETFEVKAKVNTRIRIQDHDVDPAFCTSGNVKLERLS